MTNQGSKYMCDAVRGEEAKNALNRPNPIFLRSLFFAPFLFGFSLNLFLLPPPHYLFEICMDEPHLPAPPPAAACLSGFWREIAASWTGENWPESRWDFFLVFRIYFTNRANAANLDSVLIQRFYIFTKDSHRPMLWVANSCCCQRQRHEMEMRGRWKWKIRQWKFTVLSLEKPPIFSETDLNQ